MIKRLSLLLAFVQMLNASDGGISKDKAARALADAKSLAEGVAALTLADQPVSQQLNASPKPEANHKGNLVHTITFDEKTYIKTIRIQHTATGEWLAEHVQYDTKQLEEWRDVKRCVKSVQSNHNIENLQRLGDFHAYLSQIKEIVIADRLKEAKAKPDILFRQNYASFEIPSE